MFLGINRFSIWVVCHAQTAVAAAAAIAVVIVIVSVVSIIIVIAIAAAPPSLLVCFSMSSSLFAAHCIFVLAACAAWGAVCNSLCSIDVACSIVMRVLLKLQLPRKSHSNMQHGNMQPSEAYRNNHSHHPKVLYLFWSALHMNTTLEQSDSGRLAD